MYDETMPLLRDNFEQKPIEKMQGRVGMFGTLGGARLFGVFEFYLLVLSFFISAGVSTGRDPLRIPFAVFDR